MLNNKKAWHICELVGRCPDDYCKYGDEFVGISYSSKYSKYFEGLPKDMQRFYIHCSLPWEYPTDQGLALKL